MTKIWKQGIGVMGRRRTDELSGALDRVGCTWLTLGPRESRFEISNGCGKATKKENRAVSQFTDTAIFSYHCDYQGSVLVIPWSCSGADYVTAA